MGMKIHFKLHKSIDKESAAIWKNFQILQV